MRRRGDVDVRVVQDLARALRPTVDLHRRRADPLEEDVNLLAHDLGRAGRDGQRREGQERQQRTDPDHQDDRDPRGTFRSEHDVITVPAYEFEITEEERRARQPTPV